MFAQIDQKIARAGRKAALGVAAFASLAVGAGFLTLAAWIWLVTLTDPLVASIVIGCIYLGVGFILLACVKLLGGPVAAAPRPQAAASDPPATPDMPPLMAAFIHGMQAGAQSRPKSSK